MNTYPLPPYCGSVHGEYHCTRTPGHEGRHMWTASHGASGRVVVWDAA